MWLCCFKDPELGKLELKENDWPSQVANVSKSNAFVGVPSCENLRKIHLYNIFHIIEKKIVQNKKRYKLLVPFFMKKKKQN